MEKSDRFIIGKILIEVLEKHVNRLDPYDDDLAEIVQRAYKTHLKMHRTYENWGRPVEMLEQLDKMDSIIKKLHQMQNKQCY